MQGKKNNIKHLMSLNPQAGITLDVEINNYLLHPAYPLHPVHYLIKQIWRLC